MPTCSRSSTCLTLPWPSSRGRHSARRSALGWIPRSSHPLLLVGVLPLPRFAVDPPLRSLPLPLPPLSLPSALSPWPVIPLPPLRPHPRLVPRAQHLWLLPRLVCRMRPPSRPSAVAESPSPLLLPPLPRGHHPNAPLPPFPPLSALRLVPAALRGLRLTPPLPPPRVPAAPTAGPRARSTSLGIPLPSGPSPTPLPPLPLPSTGRRRSTPG